jgi:ligand-binding sensor protein
MQLYRKDTNNLQLYRTHVEETWNADPEILQEFDSVFEDTKTKLSKIIALTKFKSKTVNCGISVLDTA